MKTVRATVYRVNDTWLMPTMAETRAGFFLEREPIEVVHGLDPADLVAALERIIQRGHPVVRTPKREEYEDVLPVEYGARTWKEFAKKARCWSLVAGAGQVELTPEKRMLGGSFVPVVERKQVYPSLNAVAEALVRSAAE